MIPRYARADMMAIWEPEARYQIWLHIERLACEAQEELGVIPKGVAKALEERGRFDVGRVEEIERDVKHDVIAFLTNVAEHVGAEARFVHQGMTSSDVLDTCFAVQLSRAADILLDDLDKLLSALRRRPMSTRPRSASAAATASTPNPRRIGLKLAGGLCRVRPQPRTTGSSQRVRKLPPARSRGRSAPSPISTRFVEAYVAEKLGAGGGTGLYSGDPARPPRDSFSPPLAVIASSIERLRRWKSAICSEPSCAKQRSISRRGPEGLFGDAP